MRRASLPHYGFSPFVLLCLAAVLLPVLLTVLGIDGRSLQFIGAKVPTVRIAQRPAALTSGDLPAFVRTDRGLVTVLPCVP